LIMISYLLDLVLRKLVKITVVRYTKKLKIKIQMWYFIHKHYKTDKVKMTRWLWRYTAVGTLSY